jgi:hypothetical protein
MVTINYSGRTFNNFFQYIFARLIGHYNDLQVVTEWKHPDFITVKEQSHSGKFIIPEEINDTFQRPRDLNWLQPGRYSGKHVILKGYFQYSDFYDPNKEIIKSWIDLPQITGEHENDIVLHVRLDDYIGMTGKTVIHPIWYYNVLKNNDLLGKTLYCVVEEPKQEWEREYIKKLKKLIPNIKMKSGTAKGDWEFIRQAGIIICSNSSYCWWAAFLSNAKKVFSFQRWLSPCPSDLAYVNGWIAVSGGFYFE